MAHAVLSPSSASRWLTCTPSARLELNYENVDSEFAREGTLAHAICESLLKQYVLSGIPVLELWEWQLYRKEEFYTESMYELCQAYAAYVIKFLGKNDLLFIEQKLDLSKYIPEGFGTTDAQVLQIKQKHLHVIDMKFGKGVLVNADDNKQLKIYALGALEELFLYEIDTVTVHIYQPRLQNISEFTISVKDLLFWAETELKPKAYLAFSGTGEFVAGEHCKFCRAAAQCRKLAEFVQDAAREDFNDFVLLEDAELMELYSKISIIESWAKKVKEFTLAEALKGRKWPGYKIVEGKSNRKYKDEQLVADLILTKLHLSGMYQPKKLLNLEDMQEYVGKDNFVEYIVPLLEKPKGAPTLAPDSDKRPVYNSAQSDFKTDYVEIEDWAQ